MEYYENIDINYLQESNAKSKSTQSRPLEFNHLKHVLHFHFCHFQRPQGDKIRR